MQTNDRFLQIETVKQQDKYEEQRQFAPILVYKENATAT